MMPDCKHMIHPFQTDPGTSQGQRVLDELLNGKAKIDNRSLADLLDFFAQLSRHVNYYDENLQVSDWQPFFARSLPFVLASIVKYNRTASQQKLDAYDQAAAAKKSSPPADTKPAPPAAASPREPATLSPPSPQPEPKR